MNLLRTIKRALTVVALCMLFSAQGWALPNQISALDRCSQQASACRATRLPSCKQQNSIKDCETCKLTFGVDLLYWKPYSSEILVGNLTLIGPDGPSDSMTERLFLRPDFDWGYRVEGCSSLGSSCYFACADFLYFSEQTSSCTVVTDPGATFVSQFLSFSGTDISLQADERLRYYTVNARAGRDLLCYRCYHLSIFGGVVWLRLKQEIDTFGQQLTGVQASTTVRATQHFSGPGPRLGVEGRYRICQGLSAYAVVTGAAAIGHNIETSSTSTISQSQTYLVPIIEGRIGVLYDLCLQRTLLTLHAAYEYHTLFNVLRIGNSPEIMTNTQRTVSFGGLSVGVSTTF